MIRLTLVLLIALQQLSAQTPAAQPAGDAAAPAAQSGTGSTTQSAGGSAAQSTSTPPAATTPAASPVPSTEPWLTGFIDLGDRWVSGVGGSLDTYRSIVDLGSGPKLLGTEFTIVDPKHRFFDEIRVRAYNWGDEPYETFHLDAKKSKVYDFSADYRDMALFDFLPSYADPLLSRGMMLNEQSFDTRRRFASFRLDLLPGNWFIPYFAYERDSGAGTGATTFVDQENSFPVPETTYDLTNLYRGGIRFELRRFHATLEQGGTTFVNNQNIYQTSGVNSGNSTAPILGETTDLTNLMAAYGIRGNSIYSKGLFTANAASWLDLYGQFLYSQPTTSVNYQQTDAGNLLLESQVLFYTGQQYLVTAAAKLPHTTGSFGAEIRPFRRLRIMQNWLTDRMHDAGSASTNQTLTNASLSEQTAALLAASLVNNYSQEEVDILFDPTSKLMLRGGYRYVWGNADDAVLPAEGLVSSDQGQLRRNVAIGGITYRPAAKLSLTAETEDASSTGAYFRTSLYNYQKVRALARYQALKSLSLTTDFSYLNNSNPVPGVNYSYQARQESLSFFWAPKASKNLDFEGSYGRSTVNSNIGYLEPEYLSPSQSLYRDNAHIASGLFTLNPQHSRGLKITAGGSLFISNGSRPTSYYQPYGRLLWPLNKHVAWFGEWAYYGYGEAFYLYEGFRAHMVTTGLRFTR